MTYDVVVVGGGIGGLTVASLLSARGASVCLLERQSQPGGCVGRVEFSQHEFDPGFGLYSGWDEGNIHRRIFAELPVSAPDVTRVESQLVVRLADRTDVRVYESDSQFFSELQRTFPECSESAVKFYQQIGRCEQSEGSKSLLGRALRALRSSGIDKTPVLSLTVGMSPRFESFLDAQLRIFTGTRLADAPLSACATLLIPRKNRFAFTGGPGSLAERLAESISASGGKVRLDSPVLRLAYDNNGRAIGVDLLSGETVLANHAIVSNLTIWDTYGKLVGLNRTPAGIKAQLSGLRGSGVYLLFASIEESAVSRLPSTQLIFAPDISDDKTAFSFTVSGGLSAPEGKRPVTISTPVDVNEWFTYQSSPEDLEEWDQVALEKMWDRLHDALPELGADIEVIETANPRTFYDSTRRKLGMVLGTGPASNTCFTSLPNVFMVGDTVSAVPTLASVSEAALDLVNRLTK